MGNEKKIPKTKGQNAADHLEFLLATIEEQHRVIDGNLKAPARWRGYARREMEGREAKDLRKRIAIAYDALIEKAQNNEPLDVDLLLQMHKDVVDGGQFRLRGVRVGKKDPVRRPHSSKVPALVEEALQRANDGMEPLPLAAARLHLELLIIHPFSDSNGRVARLAASYLLMRSGYHSTLLSSVEQHFSIQPRAYQRAFKILRAGREEDHALWLITALEAMMFNSMKAAWFGTRRDELIKAAERVEIPPEKQEKSIIDYDLGKYTKGAKSLKNALGKVHSPLVRLAKKMQTGELEALINQVERLYQEQLDEGMEEDSYVSTMLESLKNVK